MWLGRVQSLIYPFVSHPKVVLAAASITSCGIGLRAGWKMAERKLASQFETELSEAVEEARAFYRTQEAPVVVEEPVIDDSDLEEAIEALRKYSSGAVSSPLYPKETREGERVHGYQSEGHQYEIYKTSDELIVWQNDIVVKREPFGEEDVVNVFTKATEDGLEPFNFEAEQRERTAGYPYVITEQEYMTNESGFDQVRLAYFEEDDVLVRENDDPVTDDDLVGGKNLTKFGYGSNDKNIVFVRNVALQTEFEITREQGAYAEVVHGFIEHSNQPRLKKFRNHRDE